MLLALYTLFFFISLVFIIMGYYSETDSLKLVGWTFILILGFTIAGAGGSGISYHDGDNITVSGSTTVITPNYSSYNNHFFGYWIMVLSFVGFAAAFFDRRKGVDD